MKRFAQWCISHEIKFTRFCLILPGLYFIVGFCMGFITEYNFDDWHFWASAIYFGLLYAPLALVWSFDILSWMEDTFHVRSDHC